MLYRGQKTKDVVEAFITIVITSILCERVTTPWLTFYLPRESHVENLVQISPNLAKSPPSPHTPFSVVVLLVRTATLTGAEPRVLDVVADGVYYYNLSALFCLRRICRRGYELESIAVAHVVNEEREVGLTAPV